MAHEATINARMPESLKRGGSAVLQRNGVSPTQLIRSVYRYLEREQKIPECLDVHTTGNVDEGARRRELARSIAGSISLPSDYDFGVARQERVSEKYGDLL